MKLYEIAEQYQFLQAALEEQEFSEQVIQDTMEDIQDTADGKIDNIANLIKDMQGDIDGIEKEIGNLNERLKQKKRSVEWLKGYLTNNLPLLGYADRPFENERHKLYFRKSRETRITDEQAFIGWAELNAPDLLKYKMPEPNKTAIKEWIKDGNVCEYAEIVDKKNIQVK